MLNNSGDSLFTIADNIGYQSEADFSLAFKKQFGVIPIEVMNRSFIISFGIRPGEYRKKHSTEVESRNKKGE